MPTVPAGNPNRWWRVREDEIFWFETTAREDFGKDLNAPQLGEKGQPEWSYDFVTEVEGGDVVLHYRTRPNKELVGWSRAVGQPYADEVLWGAHGQASGRGPVDPYERPGWRIGLDGPFLLSEPIDLERMRELEPAIRGVRDELKAEIRGPIYFPFAFSPSRPLRATQFYLTKAPRALLLAVPELVEIEALARATAPLPEQPAPHAAVGALGSEYRREDEEVITSTREPFAVLDPAIVERGLRGHKRTQNALADLVRSQGFVPRSPDPGEPPFDLAWEENGSVVVVEVKSVTNTNEERQLRLGLGQVLRYAYQLRSRNVPVRAVLAIERPPHDPSWLEVCQAVDVNLVWPPDF